MALGTFLRYVLEEGRERYAAAQDLEAGFKAVAGKLAERIDHDVTDGRLKAKPWKPRWTPPKR